MTAQSHHQLVSETEEKPVGLNIVVAQPVTLVTRAIDVVVSVALIVLLSPVWIVSALAIVVTSGRPILFRQERLGKDFLPFRVLKFRTMIADNDDSAHRKQNELELRGVVVPIDGVFKDGEDPRITPIGRVLRRFSIDELPQLLNVLAGHMSLVGPRPSLLWEVDLYDEHQLIRQLVRPGLTGPWQVAGRNLLDMKTMLDLDCDYVRNRSTWLDIKILAKTPAVVLSGRGAR